LFSAELEQVPQVIRRHTMGKLKLLLFVVSAVFFAASTGFAAEKSFQADLTSKKELKAHTSVASGKAEFKLSKDGKSLSYKLYAHDITNATAAHIHIGNIKEDGPPVIIIPFDGATKGKFSGLLSEGKITEMDMLGRLESKPFDVLVKLIESGNVYVNIHSHGNPDGEIRGQIR
jgi:uncharacterized protein YfiM (DUF2279 family)